MKAKPLTSLVDTPVAVRIVNRDGPTFRPGRPFELPVTVTNSGQAPLTWTQHNALNLSYRWLDRDGNIVEREGLRTAIPGDLAPGVETEITVGGICPSEDGEHSLLLSLVLEGHHWACDVSSSGSISHRLVVVPIAAWPAEFRDSDGAKAIRGAIVANDLRLSLEARTRAEVKKAISVVDIPVAERLGTSARSRDNLFGRFGQWFEGKSNLRALDEKVDQILDIVNQQDRQFRSLEQQIDELRNHRDGQGEETVPDFMENLAQARAKVKLHLLARLGASLGPRGQSRRSSPQSSAPAAKREPQSRPSR